LQGHLLERCYVPPNPAPKGLRRTEDAMRVADLERASKALVDRLFVRALVRLPVSPTSLTMMGALLNGIVAALLAWGYLPGAALLMLAAASFDLADGAMARATGQQSKLGAVLDATMDRYSETLVGLGLLAHLVGRGEALDLISLYLFLSGSLLFSYVRARAEAEGFEANVGLFNRPVRVFLLAVGLLAGQLRVALWILAAGVHVGAFRRLVAVWMQTEGEASTGRWFLRR
jgi:CDP-diacylglycerol--glycerol-3-phosphate 3-phosphatidyltransferase